MASNKLFPPTLEGTLPAFYKDYKNEDSDKTTGASINIPFSLGRAVSINEISMISARFSTTSTNSLVLTLITDQFNFTDENMAYFKLTADQAEKLNEGQYYRVQLAFIDNNEVLGYYSTVGIIKCVAKPTCVLNNFTIADVNVFQTEIVGVYTQNTKYGDTTEKVFKYRFVLYDKEEQILVDSDWKLHDATQDTVSESSRDIFKIYTELDEGEIGTLEYMVQTINGLEISSPPYKVMKIESVDLEYPLELYTLNNFSEGCVELYLHGVYNHGLIGEDDLTKGQEAVYSGTFVITRSDEYSDYKEWREITRFIIAGDYASHFGFRDFTVEQGVYYRYGIQQYNINYIYSEKVLSYDITPFQQVGVPQYEWMQKAKAAGQGPVRADFEDMFLFDGQRQLKIRFNPKVTSFKNTIPEQKIETIGSKYPFIFRNGHTNYKEFPIGGLISYTADDSALFLFDKELEDSHILDEQQVRKRSNPYGFTAVYDDDGKILKSLNYTGTQLHSAIEKNYWINAYEERDPYTKIVTQKKDYVKYTDKEIQQGKTLKGVVYFDPYIKNTTTGYSRKDLWLYGINDSVNPRDITGVVRQNRDSTSENITAERYFKLKVLDWLTDGNIKLFKSPTEGNYLVRLINTQLQPQEQLGRMLHNFTCQAYQIDELSYDNLVYYNIITNNTPIITSTLWKSVDLKKTLLDSDNTIYNDINFEGNNPLFIYFDDFMPGDTIRIYFAEESDPLYYVIGATGNYFIDSENRRIISVAVKSASTAYAEHDPIEYSRIVTYSYLGLGSSRFDAIFALKTKVPVAETFVGPKDDLLNPYDIAPTENEYGYGESYLATEKSIKDRVLATLINRENLNYTIGPYASKFHALTIEILHARKRHVLPIYACENLAWDQETKQFSLMPTTGIYYNTDNEPIDYENEGTLFCVTPFGVGYVNSKMMYNFKGDEVYIITPEEQIDSVNTERLNLQKIENKLPYLIDYDYEGYDLLKVYVPKVKETIRDEVEQVLVKGNIIPSKIVPYGSYVTFNSDDVIQEEGYTFYKWTATIPEEYINDQIIYSIGSETSIILRVKNTKTNELEYLSGQSEYIISDYNDKEFWITQNTPMSASYYRIYEMNGYIEKTLVDLSPAMKDFPYFSIYDAWEENPDKEHLYFDTYSHTWWPADREYDPTFSLINFPEHDPKIIPDQIRDNFSAEIIKTPLILSHPHGKLPLEPVLNVQTNEWVYRDSIDNRQTNILKDENGEPQREQNGKIKKVSEGYYPTLQKNMDIIDLSMIDEFVINDMRAPDRIRIGSGVVLDISTRLQIVDYTVEEKQNECWQYKNEYLDAKQDYYNLLVNTYKDTTQIEYKIAAYRTLINNVNNLEAEIAMLNNAMHETDTLAEALTKRLTDINYGMYDMQNEYLNHLYQLIKNIKLPTSVDDTQSDFVPLLTSDLKEDYRQYIGENPDRPELLDERTIYNRNYYYNNRMEQFYYIDNPTNPTSVLIPSDQLSFYYNKETDKDGNETSLWSAATDNGAYTLWSAKPNVFGDEYYNKMLDKIYRLTIQTPIAGTNIPVYNLMNELYDAIGRIPSWVKNYKDYRDWLKSLLNKKVGQAYALLHYFDSLPSDLDYVVLNDQNRLMQITPTFQAPSLVENHPYADLSYDNPSLIHTDGLLYMYFDGEIDNVKFNKNLTQKKQINEEFLSTGGSTTVILKQEQGTALQEKNNAAKALINHPEIIAKKGKPLERSICTHKCHIYWNIEKDYYIQPVWLEMNSTNPNQNLGPGFYAVYIFTDTGRPKARRANFSTFTLYNTNIREFESEDFATKTDAQKANIVNNINSSFNTLVDAYNAIANANGLERMTLCQYTETGGSEGEAEVIEYLVTQKYPKDYYYNEAGLIIFNTSANIYFDYPTSVINPQDPDTGEYAIDYLGDYTTNIWSKVGGLLVDDIPLGSITMPEGLDENSAEYYYWDYLVNNISNSCSKNAVLQKYYKWQDSGNALTKIQDEYNIWGNGILNGDGSRTYPVSRGGITGEGLTNIEPIEEELEALVAEQDALKAQIKAASILTTTELRTGRMHETDKKFKELIGLITELIDEVGLSEKEYIELVSFDLKKQEMDALIVSYLEKAFSQTGEPVFDEESTYIEQINSIFKQNEYVPGKGYLRDENHNIYTYDTWKVLIQQRKDQLIRDGWITRETVSQIENIINQINQYTEKYYAFRYKYLIREKTNELYDINNAIILRIRDSYIHEIDSLKSQTQNLYNLYNIAWVSYVQRVDYLCNLFWSEVVTDLGINMLIQKYQDSLVKSDDASLNDSSINGAIHEYWDIINEFLRYYEATQLHSPGNGLQEKYASEIELRNKDHYNYHYSEDGPDDTHVDIDVIVKNENGTTNFNDPESEDYLSRNADKYFEDYETNYNILTSLNDIQKEYSKLVTEKEKEKAQINKDIKDLGKWDESNLPEAFNQSKETMKILEALAKYLAALGFRYYHEVEMLYKK